MKNLSLELPKYSYGMLKAQQETLVTSFKNAMNRTIDAWNDQINHELGIFDGSEQDARKSYDAYDVWSNTLVEGAVGIVAVYDELKSRGWQHEDLKEQFEYFSHAAKKLSPMRDNGEIEHPELIVGAFRHMPDYDMPEMLKVALKKAPKAKNA